MTNDENVYIGNGSLPSYITAGLWSISKTGRVKLYGRGTNIKTTVDVSEILKRQLVNPYEEIHINSEEFTDKSTGKVRNVSTIEILLEGNKKEEK